LIDDLTRLGESLENDVGTDLERVNAGGKYEKYRCLWTAFFVGFGKWN